MSQGELAVCDIQHMPGSLAKKTMICHYGKINSSSYVTTILTAFSLNPNI